MLIYDNNKKFLGIDDDDLKHLGFSTAGSLFEHCNDFADLFVKRPGYIHNFKNFEWIDFVLHADAEDAKAIIHTPSRNFTCNLVIRPFYLSATPSNEGYLIQLQGLKPLSAEEDAKIAQDVQMHPMPTVATKPVPSKIATSLPDVTLPNFDDMPGTELNEPDIFDVPDTSYEPEPLSITPSYEENQPFKLDVDDIYQDTAPAAVMPEPADLPVIEEPVFETETAPQPVSMPSSPKRSNLPDIPMLGDRLTANDKSFIDNLSVNRDYSYDPNIAAQELGLPVDLIQEFIGDFIQQSHDFHDPLFDALASNDLETIKTLSHKLKGVAANLRIEDSFEVLSIINTTKDFDEISANLKYYYHLIAKLEGNESAQLDMSSDVSDDVSRYEEPEEEAIMTPEQELPSEPELPSASDDDIYPFAPAFKTEPEQSADSDDDMLIGIKSYDTPIEPVDSPEERVTDEAFDIPENPAYFETPVSDNVSSEEPFAPTINEEEPFAGLKQMDDEPMLIVEPEPYTPHNEPVLKKELLDIELSEEPETIEAPLQSEIALNALQYDIQKTAGELGLPESIVRDLMEEFTYEAKQSETLFQSAIGAFEPQQWQKPARNLKGISDNLRLTQISAELQVLSQTNDAQKAKTALQNYSSLIAQL